MDTIQENQLVRSRTGEIITGDDVKPTLEHLASGWSMSPQVFLQKWKTDNQVRKHVRKAIGTYLMERTDAEIEVWRVELYEALAIKKMEIHLGAARTSGALATEAQTMQGRLALDIGGVTDSQHEAIARYEGERQRRVESLRQDGGDDDFLDRAQQFRRARLMKQMNDAEDRHEAAVDASNRRFRNAISLLGEGKD